MANMIPDGITDFKTDGERTTYDFFKKVALPDMNYHIWYSPDLKDREPDFVLFCNELGLIIFEVKDWDLNQIVEANNRFFKIRIGGQVKQRKNPLQQARNYIHNLMDKMEDDGNLLSQDPLYYGKPLIPLDYGVIFPNINKFEYEDNNLNSIIPSGRIFFWDDLHPQSDLCSDCTGQTFSRALGNMFEPRFRFKINHSQFIHLKQLLFPEIRIELPQRGQEQSFSKQIRDLKVLDSHQEAIARKYDGGHRIISGPSGCGKTLILVHKAAFLLKYNPKIRRILFVCYNITLVKYIKRLLSSKSIPMGSSGVEVVHIFELCSKIIHEPITYAGEDSDYYELIILETLEKLKSYPEKYDAILIDEGQDMSENMLKIIMNLLNPKTDHLTLAFDNNQNIYKHEHTWRDVGINARGRTHKITHVYRNSKEISGFASTFMKQTTGYHHDQQMDLFPGFGVFSGPPPVINQLGNLDDIMKYIVERLNILKEEGFPLSESAILYVKKSPLKESKLILPYLIEQSLDANGILCSWISKNYNTKKAHDITINSVTISTIHSVKGFDYSNVFLLGLDSLEPGRWSQDQIDKLVYVGITRARYNLFIPYIKENNLLKRLKGI